MALRILSSPPPEPAEVAERMKRAIEDALPGARVEVAARGAGHFEIEVVASEFAGLPRLRQQQRVYAAIAPLMSGDDAPVHAVDRLVTRTD
ncbi:MAG TPA: BolA/IbaG family iron-sulfur metabolism protein [Myxococcota bacterium]|nr:BolA/IbaG family iron-sulfur metabolism protein [Myxococcota bacterium]